MPWLPCLRSTCATPLPPLNPSRFFPTVPPFTVRAPTPSLWMAPVTLPPFLATRSRAFFNAFTCVFSLEPFGATKGVLCFFFSLLSRLVPLACSFPQRTLAACLAASLRLIFFTGSPPSGVECPFPAFCNGVATGFPVSCGSLSVFGGCAPSAGIWAAVSAAAAARPLTADSSSSLV